MNHLNVSIVKSVVRVGAGVALMQGEFYVSGALFICAEILGVIEEIV
jgi:hypothetical protein